MIEIVSVYGINFDDKVEATEAVNTIIIICWKTEYLIHERNKNYKPRIDPFVLADIELKNVCQDM